MITISGLTKKFDDFKVLDNIDLTIPDSTAFGLLGSNGAGKSTILRLLSGIYNQESGKVLIDGEEVYDNVNNKEKIFFINDETIQYSKFTIKELKDFYKGFYPNFSEEIFSQLCEKIKIPDNKNISDFSKGMKRQAIVVIGLACQTQYLLLDEAFDGLDPTMRIIVKHMLVDAMLDRNLTTIISSHNLKEINEVCDTVALIHKGKVVFNRQIDDVKGNIHKIQLAFEKEYAKEDFSELDILHFDKQGSIIYIITKGEPDEIKAKLQEKKPIVFEMIPLTLRKYLFMKWRGSVMTALKLTNGFKANFRLKVRSNKKFAITCLIMNLLSAPLFLIAFMVYCSQEIKYNKLLETAIDRSSFCEPSCSSLYVWIPVFATVIAVIIGIFIVFNSFSYLYKKSNVDMYMSLPLTTRQRFLSDFLAGVVCYIGPFLVSGVISMILEFYSSTYISE